MCASPHSLPSSAHPWCRNVCQLRLWRGWRLRLNQSESSFWTCSECSKSFSSTFLVLILNMFVGCSWKVFSFFSSHTHTHTEWDEEQRKGVWGGGREAAALFSSAKVDTKLSGNFTPCSRNQKLVSDKIISFNFLFLVNLRIIDTIYHLAMSIGYELYLPKANALDWAEAEATPPPYPP